MNATQQYELLRRVEVDVEHAMFTARQLPGSEPLIAKLTAAYHLASAWRCDQEAELPSKAVSARAGESRA